MISTEPIFLPEVFQEGNYALNIPDFKKKFSRGKNPV